MLWDTKTHWRRCETWKAKSAAAVPRIIGRWLAARPRRWMHPVWTNIYCKMLHVQYMLYVWYMHFGQIQFGDHRHKKAHLDYSWVVALPENLVWLTLCLLLATRLRNTTLLTKGGIPPDGFSSWKLCDQGLFFNFSFVQQKKQAQILIWFFCWSETIVVNLPPIHKMLWKGLTTLCIKPSSWRI